MNAVFYTRVRRVYTDPHSKHLHDPELRRACRRARLLTRRLEKIRKGVTH